MRIGIIVFIVTLSVLLIFCPPVRWTSDKWSGLDNSELAQIVECLPPDSNLWLSADQELERRKGHGN